MSKSSLNQASAIYKEAHPKANTAPILNLEREALADAKNWAEF
jgi:hypothetical protein